MSIVLPILLITVYAIVYLADWYLDNIAEVPCEVCDRQWTHHSPHTTHVQRTVDLLLRGRA